MGILKIGFKLYLITNRKIFKDENLFLTAIETALKAGVNAIQLREKDLDTRKLLALAYKIKELTDKYKANLFINDRLDIAMIVNATGVHLTEISMPISAVRKIVKTDFLIGASTHNQEEARAREKEGADFITFGPIYLTPSKPVSVNPVGIIALKNIVDNASIPVFAIGGIKPDNIKDLMNTGVSGVAVISGILGQFDIESVSKKYLKNLEDKNE